MPLQRTIASEIICSGIGLHTGKKIDLVMKPAEANTGIIFIRSDIPSRPEIKACVENVVDTSYATTLGKDGHNISTVEHLLATLAGLKIDNIIVEVSSIEVPIMDGSAAPFVHLIKTVGVKNLDAEREYIRIKKPIKVTDGDKKAFLLPSKDFRILYSIEFDNPVISSQSYLLKSSIETFENEISNARTFGFIDDVDKLKKLGLAKGGSLDNVVMLDNYRVLNEDGLRYKDEFVRHKILDAIGDISLIGKPIIGHLLADKSGHALNYKLVKEVLSQEDKFEIVTLSKLDGKSKVKQYPKYNNRLALNL